MPLRAPREMPMTSSVADTEDFARLLLRTIEQIGRDGWVRYRDALGLTIDANPDHPYVAYVKEKPGRRIGLAAVAERIRAAEFAHVDRRRASDKKNAPVYYRVNRTGASIDLELPFAPPANHPLRLKRRWFEGEAGAPSARYTDLTQPEPVSPWRRRLRAGWRRSGQPWPGAARVAGLARSRVGGAIERMLRQIRAAFSRP
jgi:hypothetical protein